MDKTNGRDAARRLLGADSDLVKAARSDDSALGVNKASFDHGQYQMFKKGGKVAPKKMSVVDSFKTAKTKKVTTPMPSDNDGGEMPAYKKGGKVKAKLNRIKPLAKDSMPLKEGGKTNAQRMAASSVATGTKKLAKGGMAFPKGMARVKPDGGMSDQGQETEPHLIPKKACGGKLLKRAAGGAAKIRHGVMTKDGKINPKAC